MRPVGGQQKASAPTLAGAACCVWLKLLYCSCAVCSFFPPAAASPSALEGSRMRARLLTFLRKGKKMRGACLAANAHQHKHK